MTVVIHAQVVLPHVSGMTKDAAINTFTFQHADGVTPADLAAAAGPEIIAFYNTSHGINPLSYYLAKNRDRSTDACEIKWTDIATHLNGSAAGPPFQIDNWTLGAPAGTDALPEEVALALSFHGSFGSLSEFGPGTRPKARHRGRIYFGPLWGNLSSTAPPDYTARPAVGLQGDLLASGEALMDSGNGWSVWSRRNAAVYTVVGGWVDNAFDTIRRRGLEATFKDTFGSIV